MSRIKQIDDWTAAAARFQKLRLHLGYTTQDALKDKCQAEGVTVSKSTIQKLEDGKSVSAETLGKLAQVLRIRLGDMLDYLDGNIELEVLLGRQGERGASDLEEPVSELIAGHDNSDLASSSEALVAGAVVEAPKPLSPHQRKSLWPWGLLLVFAIVAAVGTILCIPSTPLRSSAVPPTPPQSAFLNSTPRPAISSVLTSAFVINKNSIWATGDNGLILKTQDGFTTWECVKSPTNVILQSVYFAPDGLNGWIAGGDGTILRTRDGGQTWDQQQTPTSHGLRWIRFIDGGTKGWAVGEWGTILRTVDGGKSWRALPGHDGARKTSNLDCVHFLNEQEGFVVGEQGVLWTTRNAGETWVSEKLDPKHHRLWSICSVGRRVWIVGDDASIYASVDGGETWREQDLGRVTAPLHDAQFIDEENGWIVGREVILRTEDGGETWLSTEPNVSLWSVCILNEHSGWAFGELTNGQTTSNPGIVLRLDEQGWNIVNDIDKHR